MVTTFTAASLGESDIISADHNNLLYFIIAGEGVPYNVSITPVNLAGPGNINSVTLFTRELSK